MEIHKGTTIRDLENAVVRAEKKAKVLQFPTRVIEVSPAEITELAEYENPFDLLRTRQSIVDGGGMK